MAKVSIIMPVFNGEQYIDDAIRSILSQTYRDFSLLILNDGSTDTTAQKLESWRQHDPRIAIFYSANQGIAASLNQLISISDSPFLARMDADDIAMPQRLSLQLAAMCADKDCGIIGSKVRVFGHSSGIWHFRQNTEKTKALALLGNTCLCHPTWMFKREIVSNISYSTEFPYMEDMRFLAEYITKPNSKLYALEDILLNYRVHASNTSSLQVAEQLKQRAIILGWIWQQCQIVFNRLDPMQFLATFYMPKATLTQVDKKTVIDLVSRICPQLIRLNLSVKPEIAKRLKAIDPNLSLDTFV